MVKQHVPVSLAALALAIAGLAPPAFGAGEALVALRDSGAETWRRGGRIQDLLLERYGFTKVQVLVNATTREIPERVRTFLERPAGPDDRRLVWVSGLGRGDPESPCPPPNAGAVEPATATLIVAPACFGDLFPMAHGARHFGITTPVGQGAQRRYRIELGRRVPVPDDAPLAVLSLPSDGPPFVDRGDSILMEALAAGNGALHPAGLLKTLRHRFTESGSGYTPTLDVSAPWVAWEPSVLAAEGEAAGGGLEVAGRAARSKFASFALRRSPDGDADAALRLPAGVPVRVLREDGSGRMVYVAAAGRFYGWVKADDLE